MTKEYPFLLGVDELPAPNWLALFVAIAFEKSINESLNMLEIKFEQRAERKYSQFESQRLWLYQQERKGMK